MRFCSGAWRTFSRVTGGIPTGSARHSCNLRMLVCGSARRNRNIVLSGWWLQGLCLNNGTGAISCRMWSTCVCSSHPSMVPLMPLHPLARLFALHVVKPRPVRGCTVVPVPGMDGLDSSSVGFSVGEYIFREDAPFGLTADEDTSGDNWIERVPFSRCLALNLPTLLRTILSHLIPISDHRSITDGLALCTYFSELFPCRIQGSKVPVDEVPRFLLDISTVTLFGTRRPYVCFSSSFFFSFGNARSL